LKPDDRQGKAQEAQYGFPYHFIPTVEGRKYSSTRHWDWGFRYLGGMHVALELLGQAPFKSLVDIGCGDGRFLREVSAHFRDCRLLGIDTSERAVRLAQALTPSIEYRNLDITAGLPTQFEAATLIEVVEHIPPAQLPAFLDAVASVIVDGGRLVLTVPHRNKPLIEKHHQHFVGEQLAQLLTGRFDDIHVIPFDVRASRSPLMWLIERVLGQKGRWFLFTQKRLLYLFYRLYIRRYLYAKKEARCERIAVVCVKRAPAS
jgi:SAM-dependent methyltransferase